MQKIKKAKSFCVFSILLALFCCIMSGCGGETSQNFTTGGVLLGNNSSSANGINSTTLTLTAVEPQSNVDYAGKITGTTAEVSEATYKYWFGETAYTEAKKEGGKGALLINLMLVLDDKIVSSPVVNLNLHDKKTDEFDKTVAFSNAKDGDNFVYIIFPAGKKIEFQVAYGKTTDSLTKVNYSFDASEVTKAKATE